MKISFDFDSTLDTEPMQNLCRKYLKLGAEVYVTTSRATKMHSDIPINNDDLFVITDALGVKRANITFTEFKDKCPFVKDFDIHFDDDQEEIFLINQNPSKCMGFLFEEKPNNTYLDY